MWERSFSGIMAEDGSDTVSPSEDSFLSSLLTEIFTSPLNLFLLAVCAVLIYKIFRPSDGIGAGESKLLPGGLTVRF